MYFKSRPLEIDPENPFGNDALGRKEQAEVLTEMLSHLSGPFVFALNAPWGAGKTTFLRMWLANLRLNNFHVVNFNAWENDFSDNAMASLISELEEEIQLRNGILASRSRKLFDKAKNLGIHVMKRSLPVAARVATAGVVDEKVISGDQLSQLAETLARDAIDSYRNTKVSIAKFRDAMEKFVESLSKKDVENSKKLVICIDELDRCRPTYAIELLEVVKHLFDIKNVIFIVAINKDQFIHSIRAIYGIGFDSVSYIDRFFDLEYQLPPANKESYTKHLMSSMELTAELERNEHTHSRYEKGHIEAALWEIFTLFGLTLREQERCLTRLALVVASIPTHIPLFPFLLALLIVLKHKRPETYRRFINHEISADDVLEELDELPGASAFFESLGGIGIEAELLVLHRKRDESPRLSIYETQWRDGTADNRLQKLKSALDFAEDKMFSTSTPLVDLSKRIELMMRISSSRQT